MNELTVTKSLFFFMIFWGLGLLLLWFRPRLEVFWKIIASLIFAFYVWFFFSELSRGWTAFQKDWYGFTVTFFRELLVVVFVNLFFIWPLSLVIIFYKADDLGAERLLKTLCLCTMILWVLFIVYFLFSKGVDDFFFEQLRKMIPNAK
jgi:hypothetical protein